MKSSTMNLNARELSIKPAKIKQDMVDHSQDPFFKNKLEKAKKRFDNIKLPENLISK